MDYDIFENEKDKADARHQLAQLEKHPGWKYITRALDANIAFLSNELKEKKDFTSLDQLYALQDRITDFETYKDLPQNILREIEPKPEPEDTDPY